MLMGMATRPSADKRGGAALCCQCGNLRSNGPRRIGCDPNRTSDLSSDQRGWRMTRTIHCPVCEVPTCHAMLQSSASPQRDIAERYAYSRPPWMDR